MLKHTLSTGVAVLVLMCGPAAGQEAVGSLAERLPADKAVFYAEVDVKACLEEAQRALRFVDPDVGGKVAHQFGELYGLLKEAAANYEFRPRLLEDIADVTLYVVCIPMDEPEVVTDTYMVPTYDFDEETGQMIVGEPREHTVTETRNYTTSLILRTAGEELALDFVAEFRAMIDRMAEKYPEREDVRRREIEVEAGELIGDESGDWTVGRVGECVICSNGNPGELWRAIMAPPERTVSESALYRRFVAAERRPQAFLIVNLRTLLQRAEEVYKEEMEEAARDLAGQEGEGPAEDWEIEAARASYQAFLVFKRLLSFDQCEQAGASWFLRATDEAMSAEGKGAFLHGEPISAALTELLDGSGTFELPRLGQQEAACVMFRVGFRRLYDEVIDALRAVNPQVAVQFEATMQMTQMIVGVDFLEMLSMLAGDAYVFVDVEVKEREVLTDMEQNEETGEWERVWETRVGPVAEVRTLWGLQDPQAARNTLDALFTALSGNPQFAQFVKKRTYQETDVYCLGLEPGEQDRYEAGSMSAAMAIVDRCLSIGGWEHVTATIRQTRADGAHVDQELQSIVGQHGDANFLVVVPAAFQQKLREMEDEQVEEGVAGLEFLMDQLDSFELDLPDPELAGRIRHALRELILGIDQLQDRMKAITPQTSVISGTHREQCYEVEWSPELHR